MNPSELSSALRSGGRVFGTLIVSPSPRWPDTVAKVGLDFVFIDTEHIAIDRAQLSWMCQTYKALGLAPIVRIPSPDPYQACMALDGGAGGVIAPYVETVEQAQALRGAVRLRPLKGERLAAALRDGGKLEPELRAYIEGRNRDLLFIINVESTPALSRLDELLAVPELDAVLIGPHDLSCSLGIPERYDDPRFEAAVLAIIRKARAAGVAAGIHWWGSPVRLGVWMEAGLNLIICSADITAMHAKLGEDVRGLRIKAGDAPSKPGAESLEQI
ncbi:MAG: aldolase [Verrucomicrobia bacterium]|nr:aldolase [Verrucomicrobiota bacterium]